MTTPTTPTTTKLTKRTDDKGCRWYVSERDARGCVYHVWPSWRRFTIFGDPIGHPEEWIIERYEPDQGTTLGNIVRVRGIFPTLRMARARVAELLSDGGAW